MDKYEIGSLIGKGSFGNVHLVRLLPPPSNNNTDSKHDANAKSDNSASSSSHVAPSLYVMKRLPIHHMSEKDMDNYRNEIKLLSELQHPGIVMYSESFVDRKHMELCIVMQYAEGGDLTEFLKLKKSSTNINNHSYKKNSMSEAEIRFHFVQMCLALHFMHEKNILHRDLKTQNIFLKNGLVQLGDFGISKVLNGQNELASTCIGTPFYMSPELFKNKPYNHKSDVWALGCILYELTCLKHAFVGSNINSLAQKVIHGVYTPVSPHYSKELRELIREMLNVTPSSRPSLKQILQLDWMKKSIKKFVKVVQQNTHLYEPAHIQNLKGQLERLGYGTMFAECEQENQSSDKDKQVASNKSKLSVSKDVNTNKPRPYPSSSPSVDSEPPSPLPDNIDKTLPMPAHPISHSTSSTSSSSSSSSHKSKSSAPIDPKTLAKHLAMEHEHRLLELALEEENKKRLENEFSRLKQMKTQSSARGTGRKPSPASSAIPIPSPNSTPSSSPASSSPPVPPLASIPTSAAASSASRQSPRLGAKRLQQRPTINVAKINKDSKEGKIHMLPDSSPSGAGIAVAGRRDGREKDTSSSSSSSSSVSYSPRVAASLAGSKPGAITPRNREQSPMYKKDNNNQNKELSTLSQKEQFSPRIAAALPPTVPSSSNDSADGIQHRQKNLQLLKQKHASHRLKENDPAFSFNLLLPPSALAPPVMSRKSSRRQARPSTRAQSIEANLKQEYEELEEIKRERKKLEELLTRMDATVEGDDNLKGSASSTSTTVNSSHSHASLPPPPSSSALPAAFLSPLIYKDKRHIRRHSGNQPTPSDESTSPSTRPGVGVSRDTDLSRDKPAASDSYDRAVKRDTSKSQNTAPPRDTVPELKSHSDYQENDEEAGELEAIEKHLSIYTQRIQKLRNAIEVSEKVQFTGADGEDVEEEVEEPQEEDEEAADDDEDDDQSSADEVERSVCSLEERKKALARECVALVGRDEFIHAYDFLKAISDSPAYALDFSDELKLNKLVKIMGPDKVKHWKLIDQLIFMETC